MQFILLAVAAVCQFSVICMCLGGFVELISRLNSSKIEPVPVRARTAIGLLPWCQAMNRSAAYIE